MNHKKLFILFLLLLVSCTQITTTENIQDKIPEKQVIEKVEIEVVLPIKTVTQSFDKTEIIYGFDKENNIVRIEFPDKTFELKYEQNKLIEINNNKFSYSDGKLIEINDGEVTKFEQDGNILKITNGENWDLVYDSKELLRQASRGGVKTNLDYYPNGMVESISRGSVTSNVLYDDKDRLRSITIGNSNIILGYWKDNKLIKITGQTYGKGTEVSYGLNNAKIISASDDSEFTATDIDSLYKVVDFYLYCKYLKRLPVMFDGVSYAIFTNYFKENVQDYFIMNKKCEIYE